MPSYLFANLGIYPMLEGICKRNIKEEEKIKQRRDTRKKAKSPNV
jgi:hypothetical protein